MSDFVAVLKRTLDGLGETTPEMRQRVYEKARSTIASKLDAMNPPPSSIVANRQRNALEDAISEVERSFKGVARQEPLDELEQVLNSLNGLKDQPVIAPRPAVKPAEVPKAGAAASPPSAPLPKTTPFAPKTMPAAPRTAPVASAPPAERPSAAALPAARRSVEEDDADDGFLNGSESIASDYRAPARIDNNRSGQFAKIGIAAVLLAAIAAGGYFGWQNRDQLQQMVAGWTSSEPQQTTAAPEAPETVTPPPAEPSTLGTGLQPAEDTPEPASTQPAGPAKFTQKLNVDGSESDAGPANSDSGVGEGTSVAAASQGGSGSEPSSQATPAEPATPPAGEPAAPAAEAAPAETPEAPSETPASAAEAAPPAAPAETIAQAAGVAVGQKAIFYEEGTGSTAGSAEPGSIVWSVVQESPGAGRPSEPAIRAEASIPSKDLQLRMTIRRNADKTLPASHIIELIFITPPGFEGGGVANVLRVALKGSEQDPGAPLAGIPAKISDGFFLIALNDAQADTAQNMRLLQERAWLDVPLVYNSGRRALITMEKGIPGDKVFADVLKAWGSASSG